MAEDAADKSFDPTPHRRAQARAKGHVARSYDLASAALLLVGVLLLMLLARPLVEFAADFMRNQLRGAGTIVANEQSVTLQSRTILASLARVLLPILALLLFGGVLVSVLQTGFLFAPERLAPNLSRISIARGLSRIFSFSGAKRLSFGLVKLVAVFVVAGAVLWQRWQEVFQSGSLAMPQLARLLVDVLLSAAWWAGLALLVLALLDYALERWKYEQDLRMTPQEIREELRNLQGNPQVAATRRLLQRQRTIDRIDNSGGQTDKEPRSTLNHSPDLAA